MVRFELHPGTVDALADVGVRDPSKLVARNYSDMPPVDKGWAANNAHFKGEGSNINIGLGNGPALEIFNRGIANFKGIF